MDTDEISKIVKMATKRKTFIIRQPAQRHILFAKLQKFNRLRKNYFSFLVKLLFKKNKYLLE